MSHNTRTNNSDQDAEPRRNNPPQYNLYLLHPQVKEQEGDELPPVVERRVARRQPRLERRTKHLKQRFDTPTELINILVTTLGQNMANVASTIPPGIPLANAEGREALAPQEGGDATANEA